MICDIEAINLEARQALTADGHLVPITDMFDADLEPTESPEEAFRVVAGEDGRGWFILDVADYQKAPRQ